MSKRVLAMIMCISMLLTCFCGIQVSAEETPYTKTVLTDCGDYYSCKTNFYNINEACKVLIAFYECGEMLDVDIRTYDSSYEIFTADIDFETIKVIVINNTDTIRPITTVEVINNEKNAESEGLVITSDQYEATTDKHVYYLVEYHENETDREVKSFTFDAEDCNIYINGERSTRTLPQALNMFYGKAVFTLEYAKSSFDYDTVHIYNYETIVVDSIKTTSKRIASKNADSLTYENEDNTVDATLYDVDGREMAWEELKEWDVVSYTTTKGLGTAITTVVGYVIDGAVTGTVDTIMGDGYYYIGDVPYSINEKYLCEGDISLGDYCTFYVDIIGNIVWYQSLQPDGTGHAYVKKAQVISDFDDALQLRMFTSDGSIETYSLAETVKYNGRTMMSKDMATENFAKALTDSFIRFVKNKNNEIESIEFPEAWTAYSEDTDFTMYGTEVAESKYTESTGSLTTSASRVYTTQETKIFVVGNTEDECKIITNAQLNNSDVLRTATFYNVDYDLEVGYVLVKGDITSETEPDLTAAVAVSGNENQLTMYRNGETETLDTDSYYYDAENPAKGEAYIPLVSATGKVKYYEALTEINDGIVSLGGYPEKVMEYSVYEYYFLDNIVGVNDETVSLKHSGKAVVPETANIYVVEKTSSGDVTVNTGSFDDVTTDCVFFGQWLDGEITNVIVYKNYETAPTPFDNPTDYAYVKKAQVITDFDDSLQIRMFASDGSVETYSLAEKVKYNGKITKSEDMATVDFEYALTDSFIRYAKNENNEIVLIDHSESWTADSEDADFTQYGAVVAETTYNENTGGIDTSNSRVYITNDTKILVVGAHETEYKVITNMRLSNRDVLRNVTFYNVNNNLEVGCVLIKGGIYSETEPDLTAAVAVSGNDSQLTMYRNGATETLDIDSYYYNAENPEKGEAYIPFVSATGNVKYYEALTEINDGVVSFGDYPEKVMEYSAYEHYFLDNIVGVNGETVSLKHSGKVVVPETANVYVVEKDSSGNVTVNTGNFDDISTDCVFFGQWLDGETTNVIVYENYETESTPFDNPTDYAYVKRAIVIADFDDSLQIRMFASDGSVETYSLAEKVKYNGKITKSEDMATVDFEYALTDSFIRYAKNENNEIVLIDHSEPWTVYSEDDDFTQYGEEVEESEYTESTGGLDTSLSRVYVTKDTKIFVIGVRETEYEMLSVDSLKDEDILREVTFYNVDGNMDVGAILVRGGVEKIGYIKDPVSLAIEAGITLDEDGYQVNTLKAFSENAVKTYYTDAYYPFNVPYSGSVYLPMFTSKGTVRGVLELTELDTYDRTVALGYDAIDFDTGKTTVKYYFDDIIDVNGKRVTLADGTDLIVPTTSRVYVVDGRVARIKNQVSLGNINWLEYDEEDAVFVDGGGPVTDYVIFAREVNGRIDEVVLYINYEKKEY